MSANTKKDLSIEEIKLGLINNAGLKKSLRNGKNIILRGSKSPLLVGKKALIKVAAGYGISNEKEISDYLNLLKKAEKENVLPHIIMDLSNRQCKKRLFTEVRKNLDVVTATVPAYYSLIDNKKGIDVNEMLEEIEFEAESGVGYINLHLTPNKKLFEKACQARKIPCTSKGGSIIIRDLYLKKRDFNIFADNLDKICSICKKHQVAISLAISFRSASVIGALDEVYLEEIKYLGQFVTKIRNFGVPVISECFGHMYLKDIKKYAKLLKKLYSVPIQPLGPVLTDTCMGEEHIAAAIGACFMSYYDCGDVFFALTRDEHTNNLPSENTNLEGLRAAYVAAQSMNVYRFPKLSVFDEKILEERYRHLKCGVKGSKFRDLDSEESSPGCDFCEESCPLMLRKYLNKNFE